MQSDQKGLFIDIVNIESTSFFISISCLYWNLSVFFIFTIVVIDFIWFGEQLFNLKSGINLFFSDLEAQSANLFLLFDAINQTFFYRNLTL